MKKYILAICILVWMSNRVNAQDADLAIIRDYQSGMSNGGWNLDRYRELQNLDAGKSMIIADLKGPGMIKHIHTTRHHPRELFARGIVLEIWFDNASEPAVMVPLADFFGDGCNGQAGYFSSALIECAPWSYNCYIPMPFKERAVVILRNDTGRDTDNYSYVEWEKLDRWNKHNGYFHATYKRDCFQLTPDTDHRFFETNGKGQFIGRQMTVVTDEPLMRYFSYIMEGNNEVSIDGKERAFDYLGTEDSFTFSWGFQNTFTGLHAGMPFVLTKDTSLLSIYRFHDHMPIRFGKSITWNINWSMERHFNYKEPLPKYKEDAVQRSKDWTDALSRNGCWVDYAYVFYWYQDSPSGYIHAPLPPVEDRARLIMKSSLR